MKYMFITLIEEITMMSSVQHLCTIQEITVKTN